MRKRCLLFITGLLLLIATRKRYSQQKDNLWVGHLPVENSLPHNTVVNIMQDDKGCVPFSTYNGLCKYDGCNVTAYTQIAHESSPLLRNEPLAIFEDNNAYKRSLGMEYFRRHEKQFLDCCYY